MSVSPQKAPGLAVCNVIENGSGCGEKHYGRGMCSRHYQRWRRHGDPLAGRRREEPRGDACKVVDCPDPVKARNLCNGHLHRLYRYGDPEHVERENAYHGLDVDDRFAAHTAPCADQDCGCSGCLLFDIPDSSTGYGKFELDGRNILAHRWAYERYIGPIPDGLHLDHVYTSGCRHVNCVNVWEHLEPVTPAENNRRRWAAAEDRAAS